MSDLAAAEPVYLTPQAVAARLGVSLKTVYRWCRARQMPVTTLPSGTLRFHPERFEMWLAQRTQGTRNQLRLTAKPTPAKEAASA